jgi:chorismate lyase/3-hydroxybenzoate synthase
VLGGVENDLGELWQSVGECRAGEQEGIRYRADAHVLYGVLEIDESAFDSAFDSAFESAFDSDAPSEASPLQRATEEAYRRIFRLLDAEAYPHLWRVWNYLADINAESPEWGGLERYRQFNAGRQDAFLASHRLTSGSVPAACALGVRNGPLTIAFMAGGLPAQPLENPRQVSAWNYPSDYGPRAPTFSRGALVRLPGQEVLFISGTASIVGHRTVHAGDVAAQARETMSNIVAVLAEANRSDPTAQPYALAALDYRVYVRHAADFDAVRVEVESAVGESASVVYVQADICRADLLVEIEATASRAPSPR